MASRKIDITPHDTKDMSDSLTYLSIASGALVFLMVAIISAV